MNQQPETVPAVLLSGNTYTVRRECAAAGGRWSHERGGYLWPVAHRETAERLADVHDLVCTNTAVLPTELQPPSYGDRREARRAKLDRAAERRAGWAAARMAKSEAAEPPARDYAFVTQPASPSSALGRLKERDREAMHRAHEHAVKAGEHAALSDAAAMAAERMDAAETSPAYAMRRIEEAEAAIRDVDRRLAGKGYLGDGAISEDYRARLELERAEHADKLQYWRARLDAAGGVRYGPGNVHEGDAVKVGRSWYKVVRANPKTVSVATPYSWVDKHPWAAVSDHRPAADLAEAIASVAAIDAEAEKRAPEIGPADVRKGDTVMTSHNGRRYRVERVNPRTVTGAYSYVMPFGPDRGKTCTATQAIPYSSIGAVIRPAAAD